MAYMQVFSATMHHGQHHKRELNHVRQDAGLEVSQGDRR
jgi:hypothetical protein